MTLNKIQIIFFLLFWTFLFSPSKVKADYIDDTQAEFDNGTHTNTQWDNVNTWLEMNGTGQSNGFATFTSRIINNTGSASWDTLSWIPKRPLFKELPDSDGIETTYSSGNIDMTSTTLLLHLNESSGNASDTSGSSISGIVTGATQGAEGMLHSSYSFGGTDYITLGDVLENSINRTFTVGAWVYSTASDTNEIILAKYNITAGKRQWIFRLNSAKPNLLIYGNLSGTIIRQYIADNTISLSAWHHIVFTGDIQNDTYEIYVDGELVSGTKLGSAATTIADSNEPVIVGGLGQSGNFTGKIDELFVIGGRIMNSTDIANIYKRAALRARVQVRSCNDAACSGESFVGQTGSTSNFYEEQDSNTIALPSFSLSGVVQDNQYFQYQVIFETLDSTLSPEITSLTIASTDLGGGGGGENPVPEFSDFVYVSTILSLLYIFVKKINKQYSAFIKKISIKFFRI